MTKPSSRPYNAAFCQPPAALRRAGLLELVGEHGLARDLDTALARAGRWAASPTASSEPVGPERGDTMNCPEDRTALHAALVHGVVIHACPACHGRWFDAVELRAARDRTDEDLQWLDFHLFDTETHQRRGQPRGKACPSCSRPMASLAYERSGVVVDKCDHCRGVWLHPGEFERIIGYLEQLVATESASEYARDAVRQLREIAIGGGHPVSELKDLWTVLRLLEARIGAEHPHLVDAIRRLYALFPLK
jgi:Zn-finger nucleic acid-binding protein